MKRGTQRYGVDRSAPMPLGHFEAIEKALELRERGHMWTWNAIADCMTVYHGFTRGEGWWRKQLAGRVESRERGQAVYGKERVNVEAPRGVV